MNQRHPQYQLLALDLDGTLVGHDVTISPRVKTAVGRALTAGVCVTLATGRPFQSALPFARDLGIEAPLICYQGGLIQDPVTGSVLYQETMGPDLVHQAVALASEDDLHLTVYVDDQIYLAEFRWPPGFYDQYFGLPLRLVDDLSAAVDQHAIKFLIIADEPEADRVEREWKEHFAERIKIVRSHRFFVEGIPLGVSKGRALTWLAQYLGIEQAHTLAVGDNDNDLDMILAAGLGVAMGNAAPEVKAAAGYVAPPLAEDGVAEVIERFILT